MKLLSIDVETTGLDYEMGHQIIEIGCVLFDPQPTIVKDGFVDAKGTRWQTWECLVRPPQIIGQPYALQMNHEILQELAGVKSTHMTIYDDPNRIAIDLMQWLYRHGIHEANKVTVCGKNYAAFDDRFLQYLPNWDKMPFERRVLDPGSMCFDPADGKILSLDKYLERANRGSLVKHRALEDALAVATLITACFEAKLQ